MYYYVYDEFIQDPKLERELAAIETRLTDLGISGKIARLALFRDPTELIRDEIRKGAKTIVAVGNDATLRKVIDAAEDSDVAISIIPMGADNRIAEILGIPSGAAACDILSARITERLDIGVVNGRRFLHAAFIHANAGAEILCDELFKIQPSKKTVIEIRNLETSDGDVRAANPTDGKLELVMRSIQRSWFGKKSTFASIIPVQNAVVKNKALTKVIIDGDEFEGDDFAISVLPQRINFITGKGREYANQ
jgi:diacylglycerol kinase family enzyme